MARVNKGSFDNFWKIIPKIFGGFKNMNYLCIAIHSLSLSDSAKGSSKNIFEKSSPKIWKFQKYELPLQPISALNDERYENGSSKIIRI